MVVRTVVRLVAGVVVVAVVVGVVSVVMDLRRSTRSVCVVEGEVMVEVGWGNGSV